MIAKRTDPQLLLRLPQQLMDQLGEEAKKSGRSRNSEILVRLEESLDEQEEAVDKTK